MEEKNTKKIANLNDPLKYKNGEPYLLYDDNGETIISRTAKGINDGSINPYVIDMATVTLHLTRFTNQLLELIDSDLIMDVAQAIHDNQAKYEAEQDPYITYKSEEYGTGKSIPFFYSRTVSIFNDEDDIANAFKLARAILDTRKKIENYNKKIREKKRKAKGSDDSEDKVKELKQKVEELEKKLKEAEELNKNRIIEMDKWHRAYLDSISDANKYNEQYENAQKECERLKAQNELLENISKGKRVFSVRQIAIIGKALCTKAEVVPKNKKKIGKLLSDICGCSANTLGSAQVTYFKQEEVDKVAEVVQVYMPELAEYIRANNY